MKLKYDNLDDAKTKLFGTYCMFKDKAFVVKLVELEPGTVNKYVVQGSYMGSGRGITCSIDDADFNCSNYNIGYVNVMRAAAWFYRIPFKQYRQGLRHDQVGVKYSQRAFSDITFQPGKPLCAMLENSYPDFETSSGLLRAQEANIVAFHKDFAMTLDHIHKDFILEYKGANIGFTNNLKDMNLTEEYKHLTESLKEAVSG